MRSPLSPVVNAWGAAWLLLAACQPAVETRFRPPEQVERDLMRSERLALAAQAEARDGLAAVLARAAAPADAAFTTDFRARFPAPDQARRVPDAALGIETVAPGPGGEWLNGPGFVARLRAWLPGVEELAQLELETDRFFASTTAERASGRAELWLAGEAADGSRTSLRASCAIALAHTPAGWRISGLDLERGTRVRAPRATYVDVTRATGFDERLSAENRQLFQSFVDQHRTFAHGGLTALDWNEDGRIDFLATRQGELATLLRNDGSGGFVPEELPLSAASQAPSSFLWLDLDGDGREELVGAGVLASRGGQAALGLWTRTEGRWQLREDALLFRIRPGDRRLAVQTVVPCDIDSDGRIDLFVGVYGNERSRGELYNTVEAHDGARNYLFHNQGELCFREEGEERGLHGTQYTYVAFAFDFDGDGDEDLWEGNDFGPNLLWENDGTGHFRSKEDSVFAGGSSYTMGVTLADSEGDGRFSFYVSNMSAEAGSRILALSEGLDDRVHGKIAEIASGNALYRQAPDRRDWTRLPEAAGAWEAEWAWGSVFFDADNDGDQELYVTNGFASHRRPELPDWDSQYWCQVVADGGSLMRGERSRDVNAEDRFEGSYSGYQHDRYYHNPDSSDGFVEAAWNVGLVQDLDGRSIVPADIDGDGDLDLALWTLQGLRLFQRTGPVASFARLRLVARTSEAQALGAVVRLSAGGRSLSERVRCVEGFQSQLPREIHCGLGQAERIDELTVEWPSGARESWRDLPARKLLVLEEGRAPSVHELARWPDRGLVAADAAERELGALLDLPAERPLLLQWVGEEGVEGDSQADGSPVRSLARRGPSAPAAWLFDERGRLLRAFATTPPPADVERVLAANGREPTFADLLAEAGRRELREGRLRPALDYLDRATAQDPALEWAWEARARAHLALDRPDLAEADYQRAVLADEDYMLGWYNLGTLRAQSGKLPEAVAALRRATALSGADARVWLALGETAAVADEPALALEALRRAAELEPGSAAAPVLEAKLHFRLGRRDLAEQALHRALEREPTHEEARRLLAALAR